MDASSVFSDLQVILLRILIDSFAVLKHMNINTVAAA